MQLASFICSSTTTQPGRSLCSYCVSAGSLHTVSTLCPLYPADGRSMPVQGDTYLANYNAASAQEGGGAGTSSARGLAQSFVIGGRQGESMAPPWESKAKEEQLTPRESLYCLLNQSKEVPHRTSVLRLLARPQEHSPGPAVDQLGTKLSDTGHLLQLPLVWHWLHLGPEPVVLAHQGLPLDGLLACSRSEVWAKICEASDDQLQYVDRRQLCTRARKASRCA